MKECTSEECQQALAELQEFLRREAGPEAAEQIERHLERCAPCLKHARFEQKFLDLLSSTTTEIRCPDALRQRICSALGLAAAKPE